MNEYTVPEVAKFLRVSPDAIYKAIRRGMFPAHHAENGFDWRIRERDLKEWIRIGGGECTLVGPDGSNREHLRCSYAARRNRAAVLTSVMAYAREHFR